MGCVLHCIDDVHHHINICTILPGSSQRWTIDDIKGRACVTRAILVEISGIEITAPYEDIAQANWFDIGLRAVGALHTLFHPLQPVCGVHSKALGCRLVEFLEAYVNVVEIDKKGCFNVLPCKLICHKMILFCWKYQRLILFHIVKCSGFSPNT